MGLISFIKSKYKKWYYRFIIDVAIIYFLVKLLTTDTKILSESIKNIFGL
jgi:hypothetical protein